MKSEDYAIYVTLPSVTLMWMCRPTQNLTQNSYVTYAARLEALLRASDVHWTVHHCDN